MNAEPKVRPRHVSDVLRHMEHPVQLRGNPLLADLFRPGGVRTSEDVHARVVGLVREAVVRGLAQLDQRRRSIVERCDLGGELHAVVARSLGISERHFYRERAAALCAIGSEVARIRPGLATRIEVGPDPFEAGLALVSSLQQTGERRRARGLLESIATASDDPGRRSMAHVRLAEASVESGDAKAALDHAQTAIALAREARDALLAGDSAAVALARALRCQGAEIEAEAVLAPALRGLRARARTTESEPLLEALAVGTSIECERLVECGKVDAARLTCQTTLERINRAASVPPLLSHMVARWHAFTGFFSPATIGDAARELGALHVSALKSGLAAEASVTAAILAGHYRILDRPDRAVAILEPMLDLARQTCTAEYLAGTLLELAGAYVSLGRPSEARAHVAEARHHAIAGSFVDALSYLQEAKVELASGAPHRALTAAHEAIERMATIGRMRFVGSALRLQAHALAALGDRVNADVSIRASLERLEVYGHPQMVHRARTDARRFATGATRLRPPRDVPVLVAR